MSLSCTNARDLIPLFPDDLESSELVSVREHVAGCTSCAAELGIYAAQAARFARARDGRAKVDLFAGIQQKLLQPAPAGRVISFRPMLAAAAAGIVVAFGLLAFGHKAEQPIEQPVARTPEKKPASAAVAGKPHRRIFETADGATPLPSNLKGGAFVDVAGEREYELVPLDEEAELPQAKKRTFAEPAPAHPNPSPRAGDEDRSLSF